MKYVWLPRIGQEQMFDMENDPYECINLAGEPEHQEALLLWRARMVAVLEVRNAGLTEGDQLVCQADKPFLVSPNYRERMDGVECFLK